MSKVRIIGDVHGKVDNYIALFQDCDFSVQIGDLSYNYEFLLDYKTPRVDDTVPGYRFLNHKHFFGNHDNYDWEPIPPHNLGDFGTRTVGDLSFFFIRGAFSIDKAIREKYYFSGRWPRTWFWQEELTAKQFDDCIQEYSVAKPELVLTHETPRFIANIIGSPGILRDFGFDPNNFTTRTSSALEAMFRIHQPKLWIFGHFHRDFEIEIEGTKFICLPELGSLDIIDGDISSIL